MHVGGVLLTDLICVRAPVLLLVCDLVWVILPLWASYSFFFKFLFKNLISTHHVRLELMTPTSRVICSSDWASQGAPLWASFFFLRVYSFIHERHREAETQAEGEADPTQGAWYGTRSWDSRITPWAKGSRTKPLSHPGIPPLWASYSVVRMKWNSVLENTLLILKQFII